MSLQINLLPEYVPLQRKFKRIVATALSLFAFVALVLFLVYYKRGQDLAVLQADLEAIEPVAQAAEAAKKEADDVQAASAPKRGAVEFMMAASRTGPERAALLDLISRYVYGGAVITSLDIADGQNVNIAATVRNPDEYARLLNNLRRGSDAKGGPLFAGLPTASGVPGFPPPRPGETSGEGNQEGQAQPAQAGQEAAPISATQPTIIVFPVSINAQAKLKNPVQLPPDPAGAPAAAADGAPPPDAPPPAP